MDMKEILKSGIEQALQDTINSGDLPAGEYPEIVLEVPPQKEFGDFSTNIAMQSARVARQNPRAIAEALISHMNFDWLERAEVAGAGFINFFLKSDMVYDTLKAILNAGTEYGVQPLRARDTIQVEYVSANPTGPLHVGHGRGAAYGSALVNLLRAAGYNVQSEYYINDAGNQIDNMAISIEYRFQELQGATLVFPPKRNEDGSMPEFDIPEGALVFPENGYRGPDIIETAKAIAEREDFDKLNAMNEADRVALFKEEGLKEKLARLEETLRNFRVTFDNWFSERTVHESDEIHHSVEALKALGKVYEKDGALWLKSTDYGDDKDRVVIRDNGVPTYLAADIAYHRNKYDRGFKEMIDIWGADHHGYVCRVKAAMAAFGYDPDKLTVLLLQMVALFRDGQLVKLSKRSGDSVTLDELIEEFEEILRYDDKVSMLDASPLDICALIKQQVNGFYPLMEKRGIKAQVDIPEMLEIEADYDKLQRLLDNLMRNAITYSDSDSIIYIHCREDESQITLEYRNDGEEIDEEAVSHLFEKFYRASTARTSSSGGAGLGLAIAKEIVELHHGSIDAHKEGKQIVFTIHLWKKLGGKL